MRGAKTVKGKTRARTSCPAPSCGKLQRETPSGWCCSSGHGFDEPTIIGPVSYRAHVAKNAKPKDLEAIERTVVEVADWARRRREAESAIVTKGVVLIAELRKEPGLLLTDHEQALADAVDVLARIESE